MVSFLMVGSLVLGLIAWILPSINISNHKEKYNDNWGIYSILSISSCAISICFQILYSNHMVQIGDLSALMDTSGTSTLLSVILLLSTLVLNAISINMYRSRK